MRLADKVAVVTGAGSGFGAVIAVGFAAEGARVVVADLNDKAGQSVVARIEKAGGKAVYAHADVTNAGDVKAMIGAALKRFDRLDILVNNAGYSHRNQSLIEVSEEDFDRTYAVNVKAIYLSTREAVPVFRKQGGGCIINTSSMALVLAPDRIRGNAICPVIAATGMLETFMGKPDTPENRAAFVATVPLGRMSTPDDIANAALYLASDEAEFLTGVCLPVDGGRTA